MILPNDIPVNKRKDFRLLPIIIFSICIITSAGCSTQNLETERVYVSATTESFHPEQEICRFSSLEDALSRYQQFAATAGWPKIPVGPTLRQGDRGGRIALLRQRLVLSCDLDESVNQSDVFDERVTKAVQRFQTRHGLTADGAVGKSTLRELNVSLKERIRQIAANIACCQSVAKDQATRRMVVNIPDFTLKVFEDDKLILSMPAIVGKKERQTPVCQGRVSSVVINPKWNVPHVIATEDILPKVIKDPEYLQKSNIRVLRGWQSDEEIDPATIDWESLSVENFPYRLSQNAGPDNSLGHLKFLFTNPYDIYLHDTPSKSLFHRDKRAFSSGCIRLAKPKELALYLLRGTSLDSLEALDAAIVKGETRYVAIPSPIPIYIIYITAWIDDEGIIQFRPNVYDREPAI